VKKNGRSPTIIPELRFCSGLHGGIDRPMTPN
jgi:hypothetical protein